MKLISMTDFVFSQNTQNISARRLSEIIGYATFLKRPLTLGMFIPCDENGNVLTEPNFYYSDKDLQRFKSIELSIAIIVNEKVKIYREAKSKVIFEGFVFTESQKFSVNNRVELSVSPYGLKNERLQLTKLQNGKYHTWFQLFTVEDLIQCDLDFVSSF